MRVLLVDDDEVALELFAELISYLEPSIEVLSSSSAEEAIQTVQVNPVDVVLTDILMSGLDGFAFKRKLNELGLKVPLVFVSGIPTISNKLLGKQLGAVGFLTKPVSGRELIDAIQRAYAQGQLLKTPTLLKPVAEILIHELGKPVSLRRLSEDYSIGRSEHSDIRFTSNKVSREHALLNRTEESYLQDNPPYHYRIIDFSRNGVRVNNIGVDGYRLLSHNDVIDIGGCQIKYFTLQRETDPNQTYS